MHRRKIFDVLTEQKKARSENSMETLTTQAAVAVDLNLEVLFSFEYDLVSFHLHEEDT